MAQRVEHNPLHDAFAALLNHGLDGTREALRILVDEASKIERENFSTPAPTSAAPIARTTPMVSNPRP